MNASWSARSMRPRILIAERDACLATAMAYALNVGGHVYDVAYCASLVEADTCLARQHVDLLIADDGLPGQSRQADLLALRQRYPGTRTILISADAPASASARDVADGHLVMPFGLHQLVAVVQEVLQTGRDPA